MLARLGLGLSLIALAASPALAKPKPSLSPPAYQALGRAIYAELIGINSVHDHGTTAAVAAVVARAKAGGFTDDEIQVLTPPDHPNHPNVVIRLKGKGLGKPILWTCHLDVVEAKPEDWTLPPFALTEKDGYFYGRGTSDMKGEDAAVLTNLIRLKKEGFVPDRDIVAAFTADEESGDANGPHWLLAHHRDLLDAALVVNPDGGGAAVRGGKPIYFGVYTSEKTYVTYQIEATNKGGHSSLPRKDNAIYELAAALERLEASPQPVHITDTTRSYFALMAGMQTGRDRDDMLAVSRTPADSAAAARLSEDPENNALLHTTCVATQLAGGHAENALPQRASAVIQCRMMPGETQAEVMERISKALADPAIKVSVIWPADLSPESPPTPALMNAFADLAHRMWPDIPVIPAMAEGASDAIYTRQAGIPTYGFGSIPFDVDDQRAHGRDERIPVAAFYQGLEFTYLQMKTISRADFPVPPAR